MFSHLLARIYLFSRMTNWDKPILPEYYLCGNIHAPEKVTITDQESLAFGGWS
jgi:hypothetical protein